MTPVEACQKNLAALLDKLNDAKIWHAKVAATIAEISFDAHTAGGGARNKLDELQDQARAAEQDIASIEIAIVEARKRLSAAQAGERDEAEQAKATRALALLSAFERRGESLDRGFAKILADYAELTRDFHELERLGFAPTSFELVKVNMQRAAAAKLQFSDLRQEFLAPADRHSFASVITAWAQNVRGRCEARLSKGAKETRAA
jgi:hypothetical protein